MDTDQNAGRGTPVKSGNSVSDKGTTTLLRQDQFDNERADMGSELER